MSERPQIVEMNYTTHNPNIYLDASKPENLVVHIDETLQLPLDTHSGMCTNV